MKRKIIVACGGAVATSTMAAEKKLKQLCQNHNIPVELIQCRVNEIETYIWDGVHLHKITAKVDRVEVLAIFR